MDGSERGERFVRENALKQRDAIVVAVAGVVFGVGSDWGLSEEREVAS